MSDDEVKLPGDQSMSGRGSKTGGRPTNKQLDEREADLKRREEDLSARMLDIRPMTEPEPMDENEDLGPHMRSSLNPGNNRQHGRDNPKAIRRGMDAPKRLDASMYVEMYPTMQLMWINDRHGNVQRWINEGAEPIPVATRAAKVFEGITDSHESKWVRAVGGEDQKGHFWVYLLMISPQTYYEIKIQPERERQRLIRESIMVGVDQSSYAEGPKLPSYAPNLPTGEGQGFSESRATLAREST